MKNLDNEVLGIPENGDDFYHLGASLEDLLLSAVAKYKGTVDKFELERQKIIKNSKDFIEEFIKKQFPNNKDIKYKFINYGSTELVYVIKDNDNYYTLLVKQPNIDYGIVNNEFNNLLKLSSILPTHIVKPFVYDTDGVNELYMTPYIYQARCISNYAGNWGEYIPEPKYHYEIYANEKKQLVNQAIISLLLMSYDHEKEEGLADVHLQSGDFILEKELDNLSLNFNSVLDNMKIIAARKLINIDFDSYINMIINEFSSLPNSDSMINTRTHSFIDNKDIEKGIEYALKRK